MSVSPTPRQPRLSTLPVERAKEAIRVLENKIRSEFGCEVHLGSEIEFVVKAKPGLQFTGNPLELEPGKLNTTEEDFTPQGWRPDGEQADKLYPKSPYICYSYVESAQKPPLYKYEVVVSHRAISKDHLDGEHSRGNLLARVIEATNADILGQYQGGKMPTGSYYAHVQALRDKTEAVHLTPFIEYITCGQHINVSVVGDPALLTPDAHKKIEESIKDVTLDGLYLLGTDKASLARFEKRSTAKYVMDKGGYFENAIPSAASNPYYSTLLTLAGVYEGLCRARGQQHALPAYLEKGRKSWETGRLADIAPRAEDVFFKQDNSVTRVLNQVQSGLGSQFSQTIRDFPPGREMRRVTIPGYSEGQAQSA